MARKIIELDERFPTGELTVQAVMGGNNRGGRWFEKQAFDKSAASPAYDFLSEYTPREGSTIVLVNAMGAYETYDDNRNGDGFPAEPFMVGKRASCGHPQCNVLDGWVNDKETLVKHYSTFEQHGGIFKNHANKDKKTSLGQILKAFWNAKMKRVELVLEIRNERDLELVKRIIDGDFPAVSMGCRIKWDVCSICGHRAPTRKDYCNHARNQLRQILSDGRKVCVLNPSPVFFDISIVFRPADPTGFMMKKIASESAYEISSFELGEKLSAYEEKLSAIRKLSDIQKIITGRVTAAKSPDEELVKKYKSLAIDAAKEVPSAGQKEIKALAKHPISDSLATLAKQGAWLTTSELANLIMFKTAGVFLAETTLDKIADIQPVLRNVIGVYPDVYEKLASVVNLYDGKYQTGLLTDLGNWVEKRAVVSDFLKQKFYDPQYAHMNVGPGYLHRATEPAKTDVLTLTDPMTGEQYQTTRGQAMASHNNDVKSKLFGAAALSAAYGLGLHKLTGGRLPLWVNAPLSAAAGWKTREFIGNSMYPPYRNSQYITDQGIPVSGGTEFMKVSASDIPVTSLLNKLAMDYTDRVKVANCYDYEEALKVKIIANNPTSKYSEYLRRCPTEEMKIAYLTNGLEVEPSSAYDPSGLNLYELATRVGTLLLG